MADAAVDDDPVMAYLLLFPTGIGSFFVGQFWIAIFCVLILFSIVGANSRAEKRRDQLLERINALEAEVARLRGEDRT